jgi:hypothetical protein
LTGLPVLGCSIWPGFDPPEVVLNGIPYGLKSPAVYCCYLSTLAGLGICASCWPLVILECVYARDVKPPPEQKEIIKHTYGCCILFGIVAGLAWQSCSPQVVGTGIRLFMLIVAATVPTRPYTHSPCTLCSVVVLH